MPTYDYVCDHCSHKLCDIVQSFKDDPLTKCPECGKETLSRVIYGGLATFVKDTKTIGQLADKNWKNMGSYKRSEIEQKNQNSKPDNSLKRKINKMTEEQKTKYIITGET